MELSHGNGGFTTERCQQQWAALPRGCLSLLEFCCSELSDQDFSLLFCSVVRCMPHKSLGSEMPTGLNAPGFIYFHRNLLGWALQQNFPINLNINTTRSHVIRQWKRKAGRDFQRHERGQREKEGRWRKRKTIQIPRGFKQPQVVMIIL